MEVIPYNRPLRLGHEMTALQEVYDCGVFAGRESFATRCQHWFEEQLGGRAFATSSCSQAIDLLASLLDVSERNEVLIPSYTYPTVASAFVRAGAVVKFIDSEEHRPHISVADLEANLNDKTLCVVLNHYAGQACDMNAIMALKEKHGFLLFEDCAHAIGAQHEGKALGSFGEFSAFSFHETKNVHCGEGGMLIVRDERWFSAAEEHWCEGTNRLDFEAGNVPHYEWTARGSSYQPPEMSMAFLYTQLQQIEEVNQKRIEIWSRYASELNSLLTAGALWFPPPAEGHNAHIFYLCLADKVQAQNLLQKLNGRGINAVSHYRPLHNSSFWSGSGLPRAEGIADRLVRLPLYVGLSAAEQNHIVATVKDWCNRA